MEFDSQTEGDGATDVSAVTKQSAMRKSKSVPVNIQEYGSGGVDSGVGGKSDSDDSIREAFFDDDASSFRRSSRDADFLREGAAAPPPARRSVSSYGSISEEEGMKSSLNNGDTSTEEVDSETDASAYSEDFESSKAASNRSVSSSSEGTRTDRTGSDISLDSPKKVKTFATTIVRRALRGLKHKHRQDIAWLELREKALETSFKKKLENLRSEKRRMSSMGEVSTKKTQRRIEDSIRRVTLNYQSGRSRIRSEIEASNSRYFREQKKIMRRQGIMRRMQADRSPSRTRSRSGTPKRSRRKRSVRSLSRSRSYSPVSRSSPLSVFSAGSKGSSSNTFPGSLVELYRACITIPIRGFFTI